MRIFSLVMFLLAAGLAIVFGPSSPVAVALFALHPSLPEMLQTGVQRGMPAWVWDPLTKEMLRWPSWLFPFILGLFGGLITMGRPKLRG